MTKAIDRISVTAIILFIHLDGFRKFVVVMGKEGSIIEVPGLRLHCLMCGSENISSIEIYNKDEYAKRFIDRSLFRCNDCLFLSHSVRYSDDVDQAEPVTQIMSEHSVDHAAGKIFACSVVAFVFTVAFIACCWILARTAQP